MKRMAVPILAILLLCLSHPQKQKRRRAAAPKEIMVTEEVVSVLCYPKDGSRGEGHKEYARKCAEGGMPLGSSRRRRHALYLRW